MQTIASKVHQLDGFPPNVVNMFLVEDVLIDTGSRWDARRIFRQLKGRSLSLVALTHVHPDHQGSAHRVCEAWGVPLACAEADAAAMEGRAPMQPHTPMIRVVDALFTGATHPVGQILHEEDVVAGFKVIATPGHSPGHVSFFRESDGVLIAGDALRNLDYATGRAKLDLPPPFFSVDMAQARESAKKVLALQPAVIVFGHGAPLRDRAQMDALLKRL
jgi:glyoxylase-like metal-dependent hydrolase (beta-lactamase superfamily II)